MVQLARNSVWRVNDDFYGLEKGIYRLLGVDYFSKRIVIFRIYDDSKLKRPFLFDLDTFQIGLRDNKIVKGVFIVPTIMLLSEDELKDAWKKKRDKKSLLSHKFIPQPT